MAFVFCHCEIQLEFERSFGYELTVDQLRSVEEIKADMEKSQPMDRLLCGDVGFGKTEVALRAAFKAILGNKQVAFVFCHCEPPNLLILGTLPSLLEYFLIILNCSTGIYKVSSPA